MKPDELNALRQWVVAEVNNGYPAPQQSSASKHERRTRVEMHRAFGFGTDPQGDASHHDWLCQHCSVGKNVSEIGNCSCHVDKGWVAA